MLMLGLAFVQTPARSEVFMDYQFPDGNIWHIGGFEIYDVMLRGEVIGEARIDYKSLTMQDAPAYRLQWSENWTSGNDVHDLSYDVKLSSAGLHALLSSKIENINGEEWRYEGNYSGENMTIESYYPDNPDVFEYSISKAFQFSDADALPFIIRNIPFDENNFVSFRVMDLSSAMTFTPIIKIMGTEIVETSQTQYDCWRVEVSAAVGGFTAWYSRTDDHYLVKIRYPDREMVLNHHS